VFLATNKLKELQSVALKHS